MICDTLDFTTEADAPVGRPEFMRAVTEAGRTEALFEAFGFTGSPGFMGRGAFSTDPAREGGYRRTR